MDSQTINWWLFGHRDLLLASLNPTEVDVKATMPGDKKKKQRRRRKVKTQPQRPLPVVLL